MKTGEINTSFISASVSSRRVLRRWNRGAARRKPTNNSKRSGVQLGRGLLHAGPTAAGYRPGNPIESSQVSNGTTGCHRFDLWDVSNLPFFRIDPGRNSQIEMVMRGHRSGWGRVDTHTHTHTHTHTRARARAQAQAQDIYQARQDRASCGDV